MREADDDGLECAIARAVVMLQGEPVRKPISQKEARRLRKRVQELEKTLADQKSAWRSTWSADWVHLESLTLSTESYAKVMTARKLDHAVIVILGSAGTNVNLYADKL